MRFFIFYVFSFILSSFTIANFINTNIKLGKEGVKKYANMKYSKSTFSIFVSNSRKQSKMIIGKYNREFIKDPKETVLWAKFSNKNSLEINLKEIKFGENKLNIRNVKKIKFAPENSDLLFPK